MFSFFKKKVDARSKVVKLKIVCKEFDNLDGVMEMENGNIGDLYAMLRCPVCFEKINLPINLITEENIHTPDHIIKLVQGTIMPRRIT